VNAKTPSAVEMRFRILSGYLCRLARRRDAADLVLRGGMLLRHWFAPWPRPVGDLDLVATYPFDIEETGRRLKAVLADQQIDDGVAFDTDRHRVQGIWLNTNFPGVRMFASARVEEVHAQFSIDITFGEPLIPPPQLAEYPLTSGPSPKLWMCRRETIVGRKLHALWHMGLMHWRPKDLHDLWLLMRSTPLGTTDLRDSIVASFSSRGDTSADALLLFGDQSWWNTKTASARWYDFVSVTPGAPDDLDAIVEETAQRLQPILEQLP